MKNTLRTIPFGIIAILGAGLVQAQMKPAAREPAAAPAPTAQSSEKPLTLQDCFVLAKEQSEELKIQQENVEQGRARVRQAYGGVLPRVDWLWGVTWEDTKGVSISSNADNSLFKERRTESRFTAHQPLFAGFKEFSAIKAGGAEIRRDIFNVQRENITLYRNVAAAFLNVIAYETDLANVRTSISLSENRLKELRDRTRIGRSRDSEVVTAESQLANLKSRESDTLGNVSVARETLSYVTGRDLSATPLVDNVSAPTSWANDPDLVQHAENRSDIQAFKEDVDAKRFALRAYRGEYFPIVGLDGNYYTQRVGFLKDIDWDLALNVDIPIFQGGEVSGRVKEALSMWRQAKLSYEQALRLARSEIKRSQTNLNSSIQTSTLLEDAYKKARRSYDLQVKEYRYGLVTNIDVLQSLSFMQDVKENWDRSLIQSKLNIINLQTAIEKDIVP